MDVYRQGEKVRLTQAEFKAQGGEGAVYVKDGTAYKIYADPAKMIPMAKIGELSALTLPDILRPLDVLTDARRVLVGYTMPSVAEAFVLCQTFPKAFREREGLSPDLALQLIRRLHEGVRHVHNQGILIVDLNEMNFLVDAQFEHVYFIDVDSYQTPSFGATALMESVRDRHATAWSEGTDWFSFAVVSFQMFTGIHPYKGKHPALKTLDERMKHNVSVLNPDVSVPAACLSFGVIPSSWRDWYRAVFECGLRVPPPSDFSTVIVLPMQTTRQLGSGLLSVSRQREFLGAIVSFAQGITVTTEGVYIGDRRCAEAAPGMQIGLTPQGRRAILARLENGNVTLFDLTQGQALPCDIPGEQLISTAGRLYVKSGAALREIDFLETPHQILPHTKTVGTVLENATQLFEDVALQSLLGAWYASLLPKRGHCYQVRLPELDGAQVLDAKLQGGVLMVIAARAGRYEKWTFRFDTDFTEYDVRAVPDLAAPSLNFVVLDHGVCLHLTEGDELELFPARKGGAGRKIITDPALGGDCLLLKDGAQALFASGGTLFRFSMK
jgi:hypothetical protein